MTNLLRFDFNDRDGIFEVLENGYWVRATDYDALAAKLAEVEALVEAAKGVEGRFYQAAKAFHNTQFWSDEERDGQPLDEWVFSPIRAAISALEENK